MAIDVDLALSNVHPPQSSPLKSHRGCTYAVCKVFSIIDIGQTDQNGKEVRRSASLEEGDVHECIEDGYTVDSLITHTLRWTAQGMGF